MTPEPDAAPTAREQMIENQAIIDRLNAALARKTDEVRIIQQISAEISATLSLDRILAISLEAMDSVLGFRHSLILLAGEGAAMLRVAACRGYDDGKTGATVPIGQGVFGVAARRRRVMRMGNIGAQRTYLAGVRARMEAGGHTGLEPAAEMPGLVDAQSQLGIPLVVKDRLVGVLGVESAAPNAFDELDEMLLSIVGNQVANGIDNAQLHQAAIERSRELDAANAALLRLNETLEAKVDARTVELSALLEQVRREKDLSESLLRRMAPPEVIPLMLQDKLLAQRLDVTVMFTDLEGFTAYASGMEPDEVFAQLNEFFGSAGEIIKRYRGYINKTNGDGIMALFGVPFESATHRTDAALAALALQHEVETRFPFNMRVGISSGAVTAGMLGPADKSLYDVLGDAANVASRMEAICPRGGVCIPPGSAEALKPWFRLEPLAEQEVKGIGRVTCLTVAGLRPIGGDARRVDTTSRFATDYLQLVEEIEAFKRDRLGVIDFISLQARDLALQHNEAVASYAVALLRALRKDGAGGADWNAVDEAALIAAALLHDCGKHALDPTRLNDRSLDSGARDRLRGDLLDGTSKTLRQLGQDDVAPVIAELYRFEATRGADGSYRPEVEILAAADIYDALTAPKIYKGSPWSIVGALAELMRLPYCQDHLRPAFVAFVELMKPAGATIAVRARPDVIIR
ncbi:MAG: adenylate/guanylate cyclase domain-containing protein [Alphaproteobacteria bacterium]